MESLHDFFPPCMGVTLYWASLLAQKVKNLHALWKTQVWSLGQEDPLQKGIATTPVFLPGEPHGPSLVAYSPWGHKELDMDWTTNTFKTIYISNYI